MFNLVVATLIFANAYVWGAIPQVQQNLGALSVFTPSQGGTGIGTVTAGDIGKVLSVSNNAPFTYTLSAAGSGTVIGTGSTGNCAQWTSATAIGDAGAPCGTGGSGFSTTSANFWYSAFKEWNLIGSYLTPTTTKGIIVASSTIGNGTDGLFIAGNSTTTGRVYNGPANITTTANGPLSGGVGFGSFITACNGCGATGGNILGIANFGSAIGAGINTFSARGTADAPLATQSGDDLYFMGARGFGTTVWNAGSKALILMEASQAHTDAANGTRITFETTANNTTSRAERLRITGNGEIGIGTSTIYATTTIWGAGVGRVFEAVLGGLGINASTTLFFVGPGGATSTGLAATTLQNCDTIDTDANGNFKCGTDNSTAGSGSGTVSTSSVETATRVPFWTSSGATPALLSGGNAGFTFDNTDTRLTVTNASTTHISINNWVVSTTTTVCANDCEFTSIQGAINDGRNNIVLKDETYAGPVSITRSDFKMTGAGMYQSLITCDAGAAGSGVCVSVATSSRLTRIALEGFGVDNTNATKQGIGLDTSETSNVYAKDIRITDFELGHLVGDNNKQETFYHAYYNMVYFDNNNCFRTASTTNAWAGNLANSHAMYSPRCRIADASTNGVGLDVVGSEGWTFYSPDSEPGTQVGTGMRIDGNSISITVITPWFENNATGTEIKSGALNTKIINGRITGNVVGLANAGTRTSIDNTLITANTTNIADTSILGTYFNNSSTYNGPFIGYGTSTAISSNTRIATAISSATALDPMVILTNAGGFAAAYSGMMFQNSAGGFPDGIAKIGAEPGSGFTNAVLKFNVADSAKALQERMRITVNGWLGLGTSTPYAKLTVWGGTENTLLEVTNSASSTIFKAGLGGATTTGFAATSIPNCDTIDTDSSGNFKCGTDASGGGAGVPDVILTGGYLRASSTGLAWLFPNGFVSQSSSTLSSFDAINGTTTNATSTNLYVSGRLNLGSALSVANGGTGLTSLTATQIPYGLNATQFSSEAAFNYDEGLNRLFVDSIFLKSANGVLLTIPANGKLSFTGQDGVNNEDLTLDLSTANVWNLTSSTGVATATFSGIGISTTKASTTATSTLAGIMLTGTNCSGGTNGGKLTTNSLGEVICGNDTSGGSGSSAIATSSSESTTQIPYWTSTAGTPATLSGGENVFAYDSILDKLSVPNASTTNITALLNARFGSTATSTFNSAGVLNLAGLTSTLLKTDSSNNVVSAINGVDYIGTLFRDWNIVGGSLVPTSTIGITVQASSTIAGLTMANSTTTNATTSISLALSYITSKMLKTNSTGGVIAAVDGVDFLGPTLFRDWNIVNNTLAPTSTIGIVVQASSTINGLTMNTSSTTRATTTIQYIVNDLKLGVDGILASAADGVLTLLGIGNGNDENLTLDFDNASANTVTIASGTGVSTTTFSSIGVAATRFKSTASSTLAGLVLSDTNCTGFSAGGVLTVDANGQVVCDNDDTGGGGLSGGSPGAIVSWVTTSTVTATSTLNFTAFNATSTEATSTILGKLSVGSSTPSISCFFCVGTTSPIFQINSNGQVGFGAVNNGPTKFTFGNGSNPNVNPNVMFMVQDVADARAGVAVGDKFIGFKSASNKLGLFGFDYLAGAALDIVMQEFGGKVGIGTTTPWATLSVMPTTFNANIPLFTIATSTNASSTVFHIFATNNPLITTDSAPQSSIYSNNESGARVSIGESSYFNGTNPDQLYLNGRMNTGQWTYAPCDDFHGVLTTTLTANTASVCGPAWHYRVDTGGTINTTPNGTPAGVDSYLLQHAAAGAVANAGAGFFMGSATWLRAATNTPVFEMNIQTAISSTAIGQNNIASSSFFGGFTNLNPAGGALEVAPTAGCFFTATSTQPNIMAACVTSISDQKIIDTGLATTSTTVRKLRIEMDANGARFYVASTTRGLTLIGTIVGSYPTSTLLIPSVYITPGATAKAIQNGIGIQFIRVWYKKAFM